MVFVFRRARRKPVVRRHTAYYAAGHALFARGAAALPPLLRCLDIW